MTAHCEMTLSGITAEVVNAIAQRILHVKELEVTPVELRIAKLMGRGMSMKAIAGELKFRHQSDIHNRVRRCCQKNEVTRYQLAVYGAFLAMSSGEL